MENDIHSWRGKPLNFVFIDEINNTPSIEELEAAAKAIPVDQQSISFFKVKRLKVTFMSR